MSVLPLCDEFVISIGQCEDETEKLIQSIQNEKIKIIHSPWNLENRVKGTELAIQTNIALKHLKGDWCFYIQGDEVLPEGYNDVIINACKEYLNNSLVEGFVFNYVHFYGNYEYEAIGRDWYRNEIRLFRNFKGIYSYGDAQGFRIDNRKLNCKKLEVPIYHYGHVRKPEGYKNKNLEMSKMWHSDSEIAAKFDSSKPFIYENKQLLRVFKGKHPEIMNKRISELNWQFVYDPKSVRQSLRKKILNQFEILTGIRLFEYKNFKII